MGFFKREKELGGPTLPTSELTEEFVSELFQDDDDLETCDGLDGCDFDFTVEPTPDDDIDGIVLFADLDPQDAEAISRRKAEWEEIRDAS
jgi:hypothetical protein